MTRSILLGGIVGIAMGAIITFAIAHGVFELAAAHAEVPAPPAQALSPGDHLEEQPARISHRPLRPGSRPRGAVEHRRATQS
jgi:hypothetical protein